MRAVANAAAGQRTSILPEAKEAASAFEATLDSRRAVHARRVTVGRRVA